MKLLRVKGYAVDESGKLYSRWVGGGRGGGRNLGDWKEVKGCENAYGYLTTKLISNHGSIPVLVHRLIASAFVPNPLNLPEVNHKDKDRSNNKADNLEWVDRQRNVEHAQAKSYRFKNPDGELVELFNLSKFCKNNGLNTSSMCMVANSVRRQHKGWTKYD